MAPFFFSLSSPGSSCPVEDHDTGGFREVGRRFGKPIGDIKIGRFTPLVSYMIYVFFKFRNAYGMYIWLYIFFVEVLGVLFSSVFLILSCKNAGDKLLVGRNLHMLHWNLHFVVFHILSGEFSVPVIFSAGKFNIPTMNVSIHIEK